MNSEKPLILVINDDGINAPGIRALIDVAKEFGNVTIVAPDKPQSGMGHAITLDSTLRIKKIEIEGTEAYACSGTPVDCVKIAVNKILPKKPNLIVSGINHGSNSSINVIYSGTMSAALEGSLENIPSIGFSLLNHSIDADFTAAKHYAQKIISQVLNNNKNKALCLNVNIPYLSTELIAGIKVCRQAKGNWKEEYDERTDPVGRTYYWLTGKFVLEDNGKDTDEWALTNNYVSVVPIQPDVTAYNLLTTIKNLENE
ncbi:MAG: 5'/3'-nucleotidase SurE [Flavobacteriales bacterium]|nr:MAG: 5'/3'-nucleotidase SurE [Flavobacteriales bacterium]